MAAICFNYQPSWRCAQKLITRAGEVDRDAKEGKADQVKIEWVLVIGQRIQLKYKSISTITNSAGILFG